jgi:putative methyltransferase (TIGR04325 family)
MFGASTQRDMTFDSYETALAYCDEAAYEGMDLVASVVGKSLRFRQQLFKTKTFDLGAARTLIGVALAMRTGSLKVLDFGGAAGYHQAIARLALGSDVELKWVVVETPSMSREANQHILADNLKFFESISEAVKSEGDFDLVFTSGALQCCPDPISISKSLFDVGAKNVFVTRTAFSLDRSTLHTIQRSKLSHNGPGPMLDGIKDRDVSYPLVLSPLSAFEKALFETGYEIRFRMIEDTSAYVVNGLPYHMYGYFCDKR